MSVGFRTGNFHYIVGNSAFLHAFFSTVSGRLEPAGWGSRFPALLGELYDGTLPAAHVVQARDELRTIAAELATLPPSAVIWDLENPAARPPWGDVISADITSLANYFVTADGRDLIWLLGECLDAALEDGADVTIE